MTGSHRRRKNKERENKKVGANKRERAGEKRGKFGRRKGERWPFTKCRA